MLFTLESCNQVHLATAWLVQHLSPQMYMYEAE